MKLRVKNGDVGSINAIAVADPGGKLIYVNSAFLKLWGYDCLEEILGRPIATFWQIKDKIIDVVKTLQEDGEWLGELVAMKKDGMPFGVELSLSMVFDGAGQPMCMVGGFIDIVECERMQTHLAQADRLVSLGVLMAGVAHEINNSLTNVFFNLKKVHDVLLDLSSAAHHEPLVKYGSEAACNKDRVFFLKESELDKLIENTTAVIRGIECVGDIAKNINNFSRVDEGKIVPLSLNQVIDSAVNMAQSQIKSRALLVKDYGCIPAVMANNGRLAQVFLNLVLNAAQAIDAEDIENNEIQIRTWSENEEVLVEVRDTGKGIPKGHLDNLFDPFFTTKPIGLGSGLGLSICHEIITSYGGRIEVESEVGRGTQFIVSLPAKSREELKPAAQKSSEEKAVYPAVCGRVLLVDDDPHVKETLKWLLEMEHNVVAVASGEESKKILEWDADFDVILCDLMMSKGTGMDLYEWLENRDPDLVRRMVFMTGGVFTPRARKFIDRISNLLLEKPFRPGSLERAVREQIIAINGESASRHRREFRARCHTPGDQHDR